MTQFGDNALVQPGRFVIGCNYWASHAGTHMWRDWRPDVVKRDLRRLRQGGLQVLRVFPLWPDFQPVALLKTPWEPIEFRHGEALMPDDECGRAGMAAVMMDRFGHFLDMLHEQKLSASVGLLTGWMSGRLFLPPALDTLNVLTDPAALRWEVRFVRYFVKTFKNHPAILAWGLGNETNCLAQITTRDQAYAWTALIAQTIRNADPAHPVVSGMHSLSPTSQWTPADQGELTDVLTTHPYPAFTPHCDQDPINTIRPILHGTAESRFYADLGGKPCMCEEIGSLGPVYANETVKADYARSSLLSLWANDCHGFFWWCASDQTNLAHAPYDWLAVERELGLLTLQGSAKPVLKALGACKDTIAGLPFKALPARTREAVCILSDMPDHWAVAYSSFILAKQAGFDLEFQLASQPLKDAPFYLMPCLTGLRMISRHRKHELLKRIKAGATLYISLNDGVPDEFEPVSGLEPLTRERGRAAGDIEVTGIEGLTALPNRGTYKVALRATRATVLGREGDGNPALSVAKYGKGRVFLLAAPLELTLTQTPGAFHSAAALECWRLYQHMAAPFVKGRAVRKTHPLLAVTEHHQDAKHRVVVIINQSPQRVREQLTLGAGWRLGRTLYGTAKVDKSGIQLDLRKNDACIFILERKA